MWRRLRFDELGLVVALAVIVGVIGAWNPEFLSGSSIVTVLRQSAFVGIVAFGMVFLISMVQIDLSVSGVYGVSATVAALLMKQQGLDPWVAVFLALVLGAALGALNGLLAAVLRVPLIIVSLGTLSAYAGLNLLVSGAQSVVGLPAEHAFFRWFGGDVLGVPAAVVALGVLGVLLHWLFKRTRFGATVRAIGSNPEAARFIGVQVGAYLVGTTALVGLLCAVSGVLTIGFFKAVDPTLGAGLELQVIAAVVIGGTSLAGGSGSMLGALLGVLIISAINSGIVFFGVDSNYGQLITGIVILVAIGFDRWMKRR